MVEFRSPHNRPQGFDTIDSAGFTESERLDSAAVVCSHTHSSSMCRPAQLRKRITIALQIVLDLSSFIVSLFLCYVSMSMCRYLRYLFLPVSCVSNLCARLYIWYLELCAC